MGKKIVWTHRALYELYDIHEYIHNTTKSIRIANSVIIQIRTSSHILRDSSEIYPLDTYKAFNDGSIRAYEIFHYRISYKIEDVVYIISVRHTSRVPKSY